MQVELEILAQSESLHPFLNKFVNIFIRLKINVNLKVKKLTCIFDFIR